MARQIIENRVTEDAVIEKLELEQVVKLNYETPILRDHRAVELIVMEERTQEQAGKVLGVSGSTARQFKIRGVRQLANRLASEDF